MKTRSIPTTISCLFLIALLGGPALGESPQPSLLKAILDNARQGAEPGTAIDKSILNLTPVGSYPISGIPERMDIAGNVAAICAEGGGLYFLDVTKPDEPMMLSHLFGDLSAIGVALSESHAYVADNLYGLRIYDISDPGLPNQVGSYFTGGFPIDVAVSGNLAFLVQWGGGMMVIDVSDPANPTFRSYVPMSGACFSVEAVGTRVYSVDIPYLTIVDVSNPDLPVRLVTHSLSGAEAWAVAVRDDLAFLACHDRFRILDIGDPAAITEVGSTGLPNYGCEVWLRDDFAYVGVDVTGLYVIDISDVSAPLEVAHHTVSQSTFGIREAGDDVAFTAYGFGLFIDRNDLLPPAGPDLDVVVTAPDSLTIPATGGTVVYDVAITNTTTADIQATVKVEALLPNGSAYPITTVPNVLFRAGETVVRTGIRQDVPASAPAGTYALRVGVGSGALGVIDVDEFTFEKLPVAGTGAIVETWATHGWGARVSAPPLAVAAPKVHPNPFNPRTTISFTLDRSGPATVQVFDAAGRLVKTLLAGGSLEAGDHSVEWDGRDDAGRPMPSGTYLARLETADFATVRKMVLLK